MKKRQLAATVFADASFDPNTGAAGWGSWVKSGAAAGITFGGPFKKKAVSAQQAELHALTNAIHKTALLEITGVIMIQSDCLDALAVIRQFVPKTTDSPFKGGLPVKARTGDMAQTYSEALEHIKTIVTRYGLVLVTRHVKGHQSGGGRNWVNNVCDEIAKANMKAMREAILDGTWKEQ